MAKVEAAWMAAEQGCSVVILNGKKPDSILQACACAPLNSTPFSMLYTGTPFCRHVPLENNYPLILLLHRNADTKASAMSSCI